MSIFWRQFSVAESCMRGSLFIQSLSITISWRHISHGRIATRLKCGGIFNYYFYCKFITEPNSERIFENRLRFDKVNAMSLAVQFFCNTVYIHISGGSCPLTEFCPVQNSLCIKVLHSPILAALLHGTPAAGVSKTLQRSTRNGITELLQSPPPIFGREAITLGMGPHSSYFLFNLHSFSQLLQVSQKQTTWICAACFY